MIKECFHQSFLFQLWKSAYDLIYDHMSLKKNKTPQKQSRKFLVFSAIVSLLSVKFETNFQGFILAIHHWEMNHD